MEIGAILQEGGQCQFTVWAPAAVEVNLKLVSPRSETIPLQAAESGYWQVQLEGVTAGTKYLYEVGDRAYPDPASRHQPEDVHGPSAVVDHQAYIWQDVDWLNPPLSDYIIYELHVGTFTPTGTFAAAAERLSDLAALGITAIEIMPVAQFPGKRNWGYDGTYPFAVQNSYGGPTGLKQFVEACHRQGIAVILDVVYNHFGPEGNYTANFGPYVTAKYKTPWGCAINFDDAWSDGVREYFLQNALGWLRDYHIDALRLDAIQAIYDFGAKHFLAELSERVEGLGQALGKPFYLIAESDLNDSRVIRDRASADLSVRTPSGYGGGYGIDAQWSDDFHHALHSLLTGETHGYYSDFGSCEALAIAFEERFIYNWKYSPFRKRFHGSAARDLPASKFVVCAQNHDQIGNRTSGDRLTHLIPFEGLKLSAGILLTSPFIPLLFMGEEYGEEAPFLYFIDHSDPALIAAIRKSLAEEYEALHHQGSPPDPASIDTFKRSTLNWDAHRHGRQQQLWRYYQRLIQLRKQLKIGIPSDADDLTLFSEENCKVVYYQRRMSEGRLFCLMNFSEQTLPMTIPKLQGSCQKQIDSADPTWGGTGSSLPNHLENMTEPIMLSPLSFALYSTSSSGLESEGHPSRPSNLP